MDISSILTPKSLGVTTSRRTFVRMERLLTHRILTVGIALVWLVNGLLCKVLHLVPRHEQIVARILGPTYATPLTVAIGFSEILMGIWILSGIRRRWNVAAQVLLVATMNLLEFILAPDLLLWGHANALFALLFIALILFNERLVSKLRPS